MKTSNKILLTLFGVVCAFILSMVLAAKSNDIPMEERIQKAAEDGTVMGNNKVANEQKTFSPFKYLVVTDHVNVELVQGQLGKVEINGEENLLPYIQIEESNDSLIIGRDETKSYSSSKPMSVVIEVDSSLQLIREYQGARISNVGQLDLGNIRLENSGHDGSMELSFNSNQLSVSNVGDFHWNLSGQAETLNIEGIGSGEFEGRNLSAKAVTVTTSGSFNISVNASEELVLNTTGNGSIRYTGSPAKVEKNMIGSFHVRERN
jgi:hypothetical protein